MPRAKESVWDYPRPPRLEPVERRLQVIHGGEVIADTRRGMRVLETSHPPTYYFPPEDVRREWLQTSARRTLCEFKSQAVYWHLCLPDRPPVAEVAWSYPDPEPGFAPLAGWLAFYPGRVDRCLVDGEQVQPQSGGFYGGWITADLEGPFKGGPGTLGW